MDKENTEGKERKKMKITTKKVICLFLLLLLSVIIVINIGDSKVSLIGRDAPNGNIFCFVSFCNEAKNIYSIGPIVSARVGEDIVSFIGVATGKAGESIVSVIGVATGEAGKAVRGLIVVEEWCLWSPAIELSFFDY